MKNKYETGLIYKVGVNPNLMQDACNKVYAKRKARADTTHFNGVEEFDLNMKPDKDHEVKQLSTPYSNKRLTTKKNFLDRWVKS